MSYGVMAYLVDTNDLLKLLDGSEQKRSGFFEKLFTKKGHRDSILEQFKVDFDEIDDGITEQMEDDDALGQCVMSRQVLDEFLSNNIGHNSYGFVYGYVFKLLCEYLGAYLNNTEWSPCSLDSHYSIPYASMVLPVKFPRPDDWPAIDYIKYTDIDISAAKFENMDEDQKARLIDWFNQALSQKKDIYLFCH